MGDWLYVVVITTGLMSIDVKIHPMTQAQCKALVQIDTDPGMRRVACIAPNGQWVPGPLGEKK